MLDLDSAIRLAEQGQIQGFEWQFKKLCELPSAESERKKGNWNPCSERLPERPCECIVTTEVQMWENTYRIVRKTKFANGRFKVADKVLAWMPWPKPYGGEQE